MDTDRAPSPDNQRIDSPSSEAERRAKRGALRQERLAALERLDVFQVMRDIGHGRIENLAVRAGVPQLSAQTKLLRCFRLDRMGDPLDPMAAPGRKHHPRQLEFLAHCRTVGDGVIEKVEVADGLPIHWR